MSDPIAPGGALGKNAFLQLMVTQMRYQDPLQPQDNSQFLAQLAQFSSLEQMQNISQSTNNEITALTQMQGMTQLSFEHQLIGSTVTVDAGADSSGTAQNVTGTVSAIKFVNGDPQLVVNDQTYPLSALTEISK
jgi:flagellar basal-body rod modification protein FlgD